MRFFATRNDYFKISFYYTQKKKILHKDKSCDSHVTHHIFWP